MFKLMKFSAPYKGKTAIMLILLFLQILLWTLRPTQNCGQP